MATKNINPYSGLKQMISGSYHVPRMVIFELVKRHKLKLSELGYYFAFLTSADWDSSEYRNGYIRIDFDQLAKAWNTPVSTLRDNLNKLIEKGVISTGEKKLPKMVNFENYTYSGASLMAKSKYSNEFLEKYFDNLELKNDISFSTKPNTPQPFKSSSKDKSKDGREIDVVSESRKIFVRSDEEYQKMFDENPNSLTPEDMKDIDRWSENLYI